MMTSTVSGSGGVLRLIGDPLARWVAFAVVLALVPLLLKSVILRAAGLEPSLELLTAGGELALIAAGLSARSVERLFAAGRKSVLQWLVLVSAILVVVASASYFALMTCPPGSDHVAATGVARMTADSMIVCGAAIVVSLCALVLERLGK